MTEGIADASSNFQFVGVAALLGCHRRKAKKEPSVHQTTPHTLPASAPPPAFIRNRELSFLPLEDEKECKQEVAQRKHELGGHLEAQRMDSTRKKRKVKSKKRKKVPTLNHLKMRAAADAGRKWE